MAFIDKLLDSTVYLSFDQSGYHRHEKSMKDDLNKNIGQDLSSKHALITGGTMGIGNACADYLTSLQIPCTVTGRTPEKYIDKGTDSLSRFVQLDLSDWDAIKKFVDTSKSFHYLVLNAGGMPDSFALNKYGIEYQMASQLFGHYFLMRYMIEQGKLAIGGRIVWVSSGGMYLAKLHLRDLFSSAKPYDKVATYANVKRAQVVLCQELAKDKKYSQFAINAMHPGWVDTAGVKNAIPGFWKFTKNRLRTPAQGAATIIWLLLSHEVSTSGEFYFDWKKRATYPFFWTKENNLIRDEFISLLKDYYQKYFLN